MGKPEIRFKGYTDEWEQRKLGELYQRNTERNENLIGYDKTISVATMSYKDDGNGASESSLSTYKVLRVGDIAFEGHTNKQFRFGRFVVNDIGTGIMSPRFSTLRPLNEIPVNFWKQYIHSESVMRRILVNSTKAGTMMNELVIPEFLNQTIMVPSENEQAVIGQYFTSLDHLITLHQRKCDEIKNLKKYMLQKMFPQNEQKVPEIRFEGFTEAWEQRKLGDVLDDMYNGQTPSRNKSEYWNGNIKWLSSGELNRGTVYDSMEMITEDGQKSANLRIVHKGTFIMAITGLEAAGTRGNCALLGFDTTLNQSCMALFPKKDLLTSDFLFQWYRKVGEEYGINYTQGTKQQSYNAELIKILPISLPSVAEQRKIASYLSNLDHLITLHQRKPIPHPNHPTTHTKHKGEEKYVRNRVNDRGKINRTANLRRFPVDISGGFKDGGGSVGEFQIYSGAE